MLKQFELVQEFQKGDAIGSVNQARIQMLDKVPIKESRINGVAGAVLKREDVTPSDQMNAVLQQAWRANDFNANSTTNQNFAEHFLVRNGVFKTREEAANYIDGVNGFAIKKPDGEVFIYSNKDGKPETFIHEYGHIWSDFVLNTNPALWEQIIGEIILERDTYFARETNRLFESGYYDKFGKDARAVIEGLYNASTDTQRASILRRVMSNPSKHSGAILALDEIMAGAIERHGKKKFDDSLGTKLSQLLDKFWDHIAKLLGNVKGKEIQDLNIQELMDLVVNDVITGKPGSSFAEMNIPVGNEMFEKEVGVMREGMTAEQRKNQNLFDALSILKEDVTFDKIDKAYEKVADQMTKKEFLDMITDQINQNTVDKAKVQEFFEAGDIETESTEKLWQKLAGGKVSLLLGRPAKAWQNDEAKIQEKFAKNFEFFNKNIELYTQFLPAEFFLNLSGLKKDGTQKKESILRQEDAQLLADKAKSSNVKWDGPDAFSSIERAAKSGKLQTLANSDKYKADIKANQEALFAFGDALQGLAEAGVPAADLVTLAKSLTNTGNDRTNLFRKAPRLAGYAEGITKNSKVVPEHNPPAGYIAYFMVQKALQGQFNQEAKDAIQQKFEYFAVEQDLDPGILGQGPSNS